MRPEAERWLRFDKQDAAALAALLLLAVVILLPVLVSGEEMAPGLGGRVAGYDDARTQWYPWRAYAAKWMKEGVLPLWNPYVLCGTPFVGNVQSALFYPPNVMFLLMPVHLAARAMVLLHVTLSLIFMYLLAKAVGSGRAGAAIAAMVFTFGSAQLLRVPAGHWGVTCAIPWMPLVFLCVIAVLRRPGAGVMVCGSVVVALQVLSGAPQYVFVTGFAAGVFVLLQGVGDGRRWGERLRRWCGVGVMFVVGAAISGVQLVPGIEAAMSGARSLPMRQEWMRVFSFSPEGLLTFFVPGFFGGVQGVPWWGRWLPWEMNAYVGVVCLALAGLGAFSRARRRAGLRWAILAALMLALALGRHAPVMGFLTWCLPVGGMFRGAAKFLLPCQLALAVLAAKGVTVLLAGGARERRRVVLLGGAIFAGAALLILFGLAGWTDSVRAVVLGSGECLARGAVAAVPAAVLRWPVISGGLVTLLLVGVFAAAVWFAGRAWTEKTRAQLGVMLCLLVAVEMVYFGWLFVAGGANSRLGASWPQGVAEYLRLRGASQRAQVMNDANMNDGMLAGVATVTGIEPNPPARFHELFLRAQGLPADVAPSIYKLADWGAVAPRMALSLVVARAGMEFDSRAWKVVWEGKGSKVVEAQERVSRAFTVELDAARVVSGRAEALAAVLQAKPGKGLVVECAGKDVSAPRKAMVPRAARIVEDGPNVVRVMVDAPEACWLALLDNYYPGWTARVKGKRVEIFPANYAFRAVRLEAGKQVVEFAYEPDSLRLGAGISFAALLGCAMVVVWGYVRQRRRMISDC